MRIKLLSFHVAFGSYGNEIDDYFIEIREA